jgi:hypothetical protein
MKTIPLRQVQAMIVSKLKGTLKDNRVTRPITREHRTARKFRGIDVYRAFDNGLKFAITAINAGFDSYR